MNQRKNKDKEYLSPAVSCVSIKTQTFLCMSKVESVFSTEDYPIDFEEFVW